MKVRDLTWKQIKKGLIGGLKACKTEKALTRYLQEITNAYAEMVYYQNGEKKAK